MVLMFCLDGSAMTAHEIGAFFSVVNKRAAKVVRRHGEGGWNKSSRAVGLCDLVTIRGAPDDEAFAGLKATGHRKR